MVGTVSWQWRDGRAVIVVSDPPAMDQIHIDAAGGPVAGEWTGSGNKLCFTPRFPPLDGIAYSVRLDDGDPWVLDSPRRDGEPTTRVIAVYPTTATVPRNQLRLYVQFSERMSEGFAARHVRIEDARRNQTLPDVLLAMDPELWDPSRRRLTLLLDPGRIKRGLVPHETAGYPLTEGGAIRVVVDAGFLDARGRRLTADHITHYDVVEDQRGRVEPARWTIDAPAAGSREPLVVIFDRPLDRGLLERCVAVAGLEGTSQVAPGERSWSFVPHQPWPASELSLWIDPTLEDGAGNSIARVFDRDLSDPADDPRPSEPVYLEVRPRR